MNYWKFIWPVCFVLIYISAYGQENKIKELSCLINEGRYFESRELYDEIHDMLDFDEDLYCKCRMYSFMDRKDRVAHCLEEMFENYPEFIGSQAINFYVELFDLYYLLNDNVKTMNAYKRIVEHLDDNPYNILQSEIELCKNYVEKRLVQYKEKRNEPPIILKRKAIDDCLRLSEDDKLRIDVKLNGVRHKAILDTGEENYCIMNRCCAEKYGIKYDTCRIINASFQNREMPFYQVIVDSIEIGNILFYNIPVLLMNNEINKYLPNSIKNDSIKMKKIDSVKSVIDIPRFGLPIMQLIGKLVIDYGNKQLHFPNFCDTPILTRKPNLFFYNNKVYTQIKLNNVDFTGLLDTGFDGYVEMDSIFYERFKSDIPINTSEVTIGAKKLLDGMIGYNFFRRIGKKVLLDLDNMRLEAIE